VVWGEAEEKNILEIRQTFAGLKGVLVLPAPLALRDLAAVFSQSAAYLGNDSGVTQLASACGLRTFAGFNSTDTRIWAPQQAVILAAMKSLYSSGG
jgi:ADP-heptose:LPS heptosyltransferase